jgi:RND family efflux transporter MFP subunit
MTLKTAYAIVLVAIVMGSCQPATQNSEHAHDHESAKINITSYSSDFEVFAESDPLTKNAPAKILAHFTHLSDFKPLEKGSVTVSLIVGTKGIRQTVEQPVRSGIYQFQITPQQTGSASLIFDITTGDSTYQIVAHQLTVFENSHEATLAAEAEAITSVNPIIFTKEQSWKIDFATEEPALMPFGQVIKTTARIEQAPGDEVLLTAQTSGIVNFNHGIVTEGMSVNSGKALFSVAGNTTADNNSAVRYAELEAEYTTAKTNYERKSKLAVDKIVSDRELEAAKSNFETSRSRFENFRKNFTSAGQSIVSPISGFVKQIHVNHGEYVETGQILASITQNKVLMLKANLQPKHLQSLENVSTANLRVPNSEKIYTLSELGGKFLSSGKSTTTSNHLIPVTLQINNNGTFSPGSFVDLYIKTISTPNALVIPNSALLEEQGNYFIFVQLTPELFEKRPVMLGSSDGVYTQITKGLNPKERIISKGAILVKLAQASAALDPHAGHVH